MAVSFRNFLQESSEILLEKLITFGKSAYPKFGHVLIMAGGAGCHAKGTEVLMYDGTYKKVEDVIVGDLLMGQDSSPREVEELHKGVDDMLLVESNRGDSYVCNYDHVHTFIRGTDKRRSTEDEFYDLTYEQLLQLPEYVRENLYLYKTKEISFQQKPENEYKLEMDPWIIGFWLGDGTRGYPNFTIQNDSPLIEHIKENYCQEGSGYIFSPIKTDKSNCKAHSLTTGNTRTNNPFRDYLNTKCVNEKGEKCIPFELLTSSIENRRAVLAGLIDSDGYNNNGYYEIVTCFDALKKDIEFLCGSLGFRTRTRIKKVNWNGEIKEYHRIYISGVFTDLPVVLDYKKIIHGEKKKRNHLKMQYKITPLGEGEYYGFALKHKDNKFILKNWIVQSNSGKGFIKDKLVGMEGFNFDVDELKRLAAATPAIVKKVKEEMGIDIEDLYKDMKNPDNVSKLHYIVADFLRLDSSKQKTLFTSIMTAHPDRKPNIIFDVTLKDLRKLKTISDSVKMLGYDLKNVHLVWVVQDIEVAKKLNAERARTVPVEILVNTHRGASQTMHDIINMGKDIKKYLDGKIFIAFNKVRVDSELKFSEIEPTAHSKGFKKINPKKGPEKGFYIVDANYVMIKDVGKDTMKFDSIAKDVKEKIAEYVPKNVEWV